MAEVARRAVGERDGGRRRGRWRGDGCCCINHLQGQARVLIYNYKVLGSVSVLVYAHFVCCRRTFCPRCPQVSHFPRLLRLFSPALLTLQLALSTKGRPLSLLPKPAAVPRGQTQSCFFLYFLHLHPHTDSPYLGWRIWPSSTSTSNTNATPDFPLRTTRSGRHFSITEGAPITGPRLFDASTVLDVVCRVSFALQAHDSTQVMIGPGRFMDGSSTIVGSC